MSIGRAASAAAVRAEYGDNAPDAHSAHLGRRVLLLARVAWIVTAVGAVGLLLASLPFHYDQLLHNAGPLRVDAALREAQLRTLGFSNEGYAAYQFALGILMPACFVAVGILIVWRKSDQWPPLLFGHLLIMGGVASSWALPALEGGWPRILPLVEGLQIYGLWAFFWLAYLFPDGHLVPRWTWLPALFWLAVNIAEVMWPGSLLDSNTWPQALNITAVLLVLGTIPFAQIYRFRRISNLVQRQQTKWVMFGISTAIVTNALLIMLDWGFPALREPSALGAYFRFASDHINTAAFLLIPITVAFALLRYRLWDIDPIINRALLYGALTVSIVAIYSLVVGYLSLVFQTRANAFISLVATGVVAIALQPLHTRLQRGVNRMLYGQRDEPYTVLARLGHRLETTLAPEAALDVIVETVKEALKLPYAAITLGHGSDRQVVAAAGTQCDDLITLPLMYGAELVGDLRVGPRAPGEPLGPADRALLSELARQAGAVAETVRLSADLQRANTYLKATREQLVLAREEERRRLRRDLHDGLGPALAAQSLKVGAIRRLLHRDTAAAERLLLELSGDIEGTVGDIRRLVYNLRPPALDELGLVGALRQHAGAIGQGDGVKVIVDAPDELPALPAAVEVAAYRIVQEALTNVVRHAAASACTISIDVVGYDAETVALAIEVRDDGRGLPENYQSGVGLLAMRERAAEVGGTCQIASLVPHGTGVMAYLPAQHPKMEE